MSMIDTLKAANTLKQNGFNEQQAGAIVSIVRDREDTWATKQDVANVERRVGTLQWLVGLCLTGIIAILIALISGYIVLVSG